MRYSSLAVALGVALTAGVGIAATGCSWGLGHSDPSDDGDAGPRKPPGLKTWVTGSAADVTPGPRGPGLVLMGGGVDVDDAFTWWSPLVNGGDVVVLRTSGGDGYGNYLRSFGADSVETLRVDSRALADSDYVADRLAKAEGIFIAGGDQGDQAAAWRGTKLAGGLAAAWARGAALGGTSAGAMVLGEFVFVAGAGSLGSAAALADPFDPAVTVEGEVVALPPLRGVLVDTHFKARGRMGRLAVFLARVITSGLGPTPRGIGLDQATALVIDGAGNAEVVGDGKAYLLVPSHDPEVCSPGMPLSWTGLTVFALGPGDRLMLPDATASVPGTALSVGKDGTVPPDPY